MKAIVERVCGQVDTIEDVQNIYMAGDALCIYKTDGNIVMYSGSRGFRKAHTE